MTRAEAKAWYADTVRHHLRSARRQAAGAARSLWHAVRLYGRSKYVLWWKAQRR